MFGSYPYPGNILENNTIEFINVFVKPGKPPKYDKSVKEANLLSQAEWVDLTQQVWFMYPQDVKRSGEHPAPFPEKLPGRLIRMYTFGATESFSGEVILDPFCGTGTACSVAARMRRQYIGIDVSSQYLRTAQERLNESQVLGPPMLGVGRPKFPGKDELAEEGQQFALGNSGKVAEAKHKRATYGRPVKPSDQAKLNFGNDMPLFGETNNDD